MASEPLTPAEKAELRCFVEELYPDTPESRLMLALLDENETLQRRADALSGALQVAEQLIQRFALDEGYRWTGRRFEPADLTEAETDLLDRLSRYV